MTLIHRHPMATLSVAGLILATVLGLLAACGPNNLNNAPLTPTPQPAPTAAVPTAAAMTDQQFADQLNAIISRYPNSKPVTVEQIPLFTSLACQPGNLYQAIEPAAEWQQVQALLTSSGRCHTGS